MALPEHGNLLTAEAMMALFGGSIKVVHHNFMTYLFQYGLL